MDKILVKCPNCNNTFFTNKVNLDNIDNAIDKAKKILENKFNSDIPNLNEILVQTKETMITLSKDLENANKVVQCSKCGLRMRALENEVKI